MSGDIAELTGGQGVDTNRDDLPTGEFTAMPPGWYPVEIEKAEIRETRAKDGKYVWIQLVVIGDRFAKRKQFDRFNIVNKNPKAVEIAQRSLAGLAAGCGLVALKDTSDLVGRQLDARLKIRADDPKENEVTAYALLGKESSKPAKAPAPAKAAQAAQTQAAPATTAPKAGKRPWE